MADEPPPPPVLRKRVNVADHYWVVGGDTTRVFSSAKGDYVPVGDPAYQAWLAIEVNETGTWTGTEAELGAVLGPQRTARPVPPAVLDAFQDGQAKTFAPGDVVPKVLFFMYNEIRELQAKPPLTFAQFRQAIKDKM